MRWGKAIEYDLAIRGINLARMWRQRQWRKLLNLIDRLPRNSAFAEAQADDEDLAQLLLQHPPEHPPPRRRVSEYSAEVEMLSSIVDRLGELIQVVGATRGAKLRRIPPAPRPVTAMDRLRSQRRRDKHRSIVARVLPHKAHPPQQQPVEGAPDVVRSRHRLDAGHPVVQGSRGEPAGPGETAG